MGSRWSRHRRKPYESRRGCGQSSRSHRTCPRNRSLLKAHRQVAGSGNSARSPRAPARRSKELIKSMLAPTATEPVTTSERKKPIYMGLSFQVVVGVAIANVLGYISPATAVAMKPLGDGFIRLITMIITLVIFCTVVSGIASMQDLKKVGRVGGTALLYFEVVSTLALLIGLVVGNVVHPGAGFNINAATLDA